MASSTRVLIDRENLKLFLLLGEYETVDDILRFIDAQPTFEE